LLGADTSLMKIVRNHAETLGASPSPLK